MANRILMIEDDAAIAQAVKLNLESQAWMDFRFCPGYRRWASR